MNTSIYESLGFFLSVPLTVLVYLSAGKLFFSKFDQNFYVKIFLGTILISFFSLLANFVIPLSKEFNSLVTVIIITCCLIRKKININEIQIILVISIISIFLIIFDTVNRPDAYLYHLPYSQILNENKIIIGLSNLHFRFGHVSIFQYLSSFNVNILNGVNGVLVPMSIFWTNVLLYFFNEVRNVFQKKQLSIDKIFCLLILIFICTRINRYSEFGNDVPGHLAMFYLVARFLKDNSDDFYKFIELFLVSVFIFINKTFLIFSLLIPAYLFFKNKYNFQKSILSLPVFLMLLWILKNILISGCIVYPAKFSCIKQLSWTDINDIEHQSIKAEAWAKGWPQNLDTKLNQKNFIKNLNWFEAWKKENLKIFAKNYLILIFIVFILYVTVSRQKVSQNQKKNISVLAFTLLIGTYFYIFKFPTYRYGYSYLVALISIISILMFRTDMKKQFLNIKILIGIALIIVSLKQFQRFVKNYKKNFLPEIKYSKSLTEKNITNNFKYYESSNECGYQFAPCTNFKLENLDFKKNYTYKIIYLSKKI